MQKREEFSSNIMCGLFSKQTEPPFFLQHRSIFMVPTSLQGPCMQQGLQYKWANSKHQSPLEKIVICALTLRSGCAQMFWPGKHWRPKNLFLFFFFRLECPSTRTLSTKPPNYILISSKCSTNWQLEKRGHVEWHIVLLLQSWYWSHCTKS